MERTKSNFGDDIGYSSARQATVSDFTIVIVQNKSTVSNAKGDQKSR